MSRLSMKALELAAAALEQGFSEYQQYPDLLTVRDGVIQRFEIVMDLSQSLLTRTLREVIGVGNDQLRSKKDTFREGERAGLIADAEVWIGHWEARNQTSHIYDGDMASRVFARAMAARSDIQKLLESLQRAA